VSKGLSQVRHKPHVKQNLNTEACMAEPIRPEPQSKTGEQPPVVVKKYANRRLYNTESSSYITLDNLADMVRQGRDFVVYDAKSGEDITRGVLTQIIVEEEGKGKALLPTAFLRQLIGFYGDQMQSLVPRFLEQAMGALAQQQEQMRSAVQKTMGNLFPFGNIEEVSRQNLAMMERAFSLFTPFYRAAEAGDGGPPPKDDAGQEIAALRAEVENLRRQLDAARVEATASADESKIKS
jgi:polyhydroxyalkanoate synthesis repressor PhaR